MPFHITPNPKFLYLSPTHYEALQHLRYGIEERKGFIVVTGEVGCGKTTLCRSLLNELDRSNDYETALILHPRINEAELLSMLLSELGEEARAKNKNDLLNQVNGLLLDRIAQNKEIIFLGQPELKQKLNERRLRQFRQRVLVYYDLTPLDLTETQQYVQHPLSTAGSNGRPAFTNRAYRKLHKSSKGIPRIINNICDKALLSAYIQRSESVNWWDMRRAVKDLNRIR